MKRVKVEKKAGDKLAPLSRLEGVIMGVLWDHTQSTAKEIRETLLDTKPLAHTTVLTVLSRLQEKGYIREVPSLGRSLMFRPIVPKEEIARSSVVEVLSRFFGNSPERLLAHLVEENDITGDDLERLRKRLKDVQKEG